MSVTQDIYKIKPYKRSRAAYHTQCVSEYLVTLLIEDAFLAKLLTSMGLSDSTIGVVGSLASLAFLVQLLTIFLMQHIHNVKKSVILMDISSMLCFLLVFCLPFLEVSQGVRTALVFATIGGGFSLKYLQLNLYYKWGNSFVDPKKRGAFSARNEAISQAAGVVFVLAIGAVVDHYERIGKLEVSFLIIACVIATLTVLDFFMLLLIPNQSSEETARQQKPFRDVLKNTLGNRNFRNVVIMLSLFEVAFYLTMGFLGTFKTEDLMLSVGLIQVFNVIACGLRSLLSSPIGKWADRTSFARVYRWGLWLAALSFLLLVFTTKTTWWLIGVHTVLYAIAETGISPNTNNMTYNYVPMNYFVQAQAICSSIAGILGFLASLAGSRILSAIQSNGNQIFGIPVYGQQVLAMLSFLLILGVIAFNKLVISKQKIIHQ